MSAGGTLAGARRTLAILDPFILLMLGLVVLASVAPVRGHGAIVAGQIANGFIVLLFFLHGAKLSRAAIVAGSAICGSMPQCSRRRFSCFR